MDMGTSPGRRREACPNALLAKDVNGDINPHSISIQGYGVVIDENGQWLGEPMGIEGPQGPEGPQGIPGEAGPEGPQGIPGDPYPADPGSPAGP
jgi:hypothetical protein